VTAAPAQDVTPFYQKALYKLLDASFPDFRTVQGLFCVKTFAHAIGMTAEGVYKWVRSDRISPEGARKVITLSSGRIQQEQMFPFVMN
jgi:hypothetical protein